MTTISSHLASILIGRLGANFAKEYPHTLKSDTMLEVLGTGETYVIWCCWAAIMRKEPKTEQPPRCDGCRFYRSEGEQHMGQCKRSPQSLRKEHDDWCGKYQPRKI